jgi:FlaG/FlaF family flagellin (archaellin)
VEALAYLYGVYIHIPGCGLFLSQKTVQVKVHCLCGVSTHLRKRSQISLSQRKGEDVMELGFS